jgi:hypothetical protein
MNLITMYTGPGSTYIRNPHWDFEREHSSSQPYVQEGALRYGIVCHLIMIVMFSYPFSLRRILSAILIIVIKSVNLNRCRCLFVIRRILRPLPSTTADHQSRHLRCVAEKNVTCLESDSLISTDSSISPRLFVRAMLHEFMVSRSCVMSQWNSLSS